VEAHVGVVGVLDQVLLIERAGCVAGPLLDGVISDRAVLPRHYEAEGLGSFFDALSGNPLLFDPDARCFGGEEADSRWVYENRPVFRHVLCGHVLVLALEDVVRLEGNQQVEHALRLVQSLREEPEERGQQDDAGEHALSQRRVRHVGGYQTAERPPEQEQGRSLLVDLELLAGFKDEEPVVVVDLIGVLNDAALAARLAEASHVHGEDLVAAFSQVLGNGGIVLGLGPVAVEHENDAFGGLAFFCGPVVSHQFDLLTVLRYGQLQRVKVRVLKTAPIEAF
jgi:hypothetical protein